MSPCTSPLTQSHATAAAVIESSRSRTRSRRCAWASCTIVTSAATMSAGSTMACSFENSATMKSAVMIATPRREMSPTFRWRTTMSSDCPMTLPVTSTCTGCTAKSAAATHAPKPGRMAEAHQNTATAVATASRIFTRWNIHGAPCAMAHCKAKRDIVNGRYPSPPIGAGQYDSAKSFGRCASEWTRAFVTITPRSS